MRAESLTFQERINTSLKTINDSYDRLAASRKMAVSTFDIYYALLAYGEGQSQREICERSFTAKQTINSALAKLIAQGKLSLLTQEGKREKAIYFTPEGKREALAGLGGVLGAEEETMQAFGDRLESFTQTLEEYAHTLVEALGALHADGTQR